MAGDMSTDRARSRRFRGRGGCGCGCGGFLLVLTVGIVLSLLSIEIGAGVSARVPLTESNLTLAASLGPKERAADALPAYTHGRLGGNQNFINSSQTLTIGPAEGAVLLVLGKQEGAPVVDLQLVAR
jgi:hypothetical protein